MKGIILAGGAGSRLEPCTTSISKHLLPVYDKPMIYYPISTLMLAGIREILIITTTRDQKLYLELLGDGGKWGISIKYAVQEQPKGIAEAFLIGEKFIGNSNIALALGDNIFHGTGLGEQLQFNSNKSGAMIFGYSVSNPSQYGVVTMNERGIVVSIEEKPINPSSTFAVPGLYFYDSNVVDIAKQIEPSHRGELEVTSVNREYLNAGNLSVNILKRGTVWLDAGTPELLHDAATYVRIIEQRQGMKISCPEEIAWRKNWISDSELGVLASGNISNNYFKYLQGLIQAQ
jgi:glucose-1-phosphate thymidylyltransferase